MGFVLENKHHQPTRHVDLLFRETSKPLDCGHVEPKFLRLLCGGESIGQRLQTDDVRFCDLAGSPVTLPPLLVLDGGSVQRRRRRVFSLGVFDQDSVKALFSKTS
jgi:hypothetical protein